MILLADSGSTKTDWGLVENGKLVKRLRTSGMNPFQMSEEAITEEIKTHLVPELPGTVLDEVHFYGAGCTKEKQPIVERALRANLTINGECEVASDMLGAARGICGHKPGIACILGTGANSCLYDGLRIVANTPALGYILGDEGSGAVLGIRFLNALFKGQLPDELRQEFVTETGLSLDAIIQRVYRQPLANRFLASLSPFIHRHIDLQQVEAMVIDHFRQFIRKNIQPYYDNPRLKEALPASPELHVTGSVGFHYQRQLAAAAALEGMRLGRVMGSPMEGLIGYHSSQSSPSTSL